MQIKHEKNAIFTVILLVFLLSLCACGRMETRQGTKPIVGATFLNGTAMTWDELKAEYDVTDTSIGDYAFKYCDFLCSITIPEGVTVIGDNVFYNCESIREITIPEGVASIGSETIYHCREMSTITVDNDNQNYSTQDGVLLNKDKAELI